MTTTAARTTAPSRRPTAATGARRRSSSEVSPKCPDEVEAVAGIDFDVRAGETGTASADSPGAAPRGGAGTLAGP